MNLTIKDICYYIPKSASSDDEIRRILDSGSSLDEFDINFTLMGYAGISFKDLQNMVKRNQVEVGDYILTPYNRDSTPLIAWKVINKKCKKVILNTLDVIDFMPFSGNGFDDYQTSDIRKWLINDFLHNIPQGFVSIVANFSSHDGKVRNDKFWLFSQDEIKKYFPLNSSRTKNSLIDYRQHFSLYIKYKSGSYWLRDKYDFGNYSVNFVDSLGNIDGYAASHSCGCAPACIIG